MDLDINEVDFLKAALEQEQAALDFFTSAEAKAMGFGLDEDFLNEKREGIAKLEQEIAEREEKA